MKIAGSGSSLKCHRSATLNTKSPEWLWSISAMSCCSLFSSSKPLYLLAQRAARRATQGGPSSRILSPFFRTLFTKADHFAGFCTSKGGFFWIFSFFYVRYSTLLHLPPLRFHCVGGCWDLNPEQLRLRHWLSDALTTRLDLIYTRLDSDPDSNRSSDATKYRPNADWGSATLLHLCSFLNCSSAAN
jgi:hypothetical protein